MQASRGFASDNASGAHPKILEAIAAANAGHVKAYGNDPYTEEVIAAFRKHFGAQAEVFPVFSGTGANVLAIGAATRPFQAVICADFAHINVDETGAPEKYSGCKLVPVPAREGKISPEQIEPHLSVLGDMHRSQPALISISQATEYGTLYTQQEIRALADFAHQKGMHLHVDGARISNAAAALGLSFRELITDTGVDILSFGGTKNGMLYGEAVVFLNPSLARDFKYIRKNGLQLASKMRFISAQFLAMFEGELWKKNATHSNLMARRLAEGLKRIPGVQVIQPVQTNAVFAALPREAIAPLQEAFSFYVWNEQRSEVRWMCSWDTEASDVDLFLTKIRETVASRG